MTIKNPYLASAGLVLGATGLFAGMALSSSIPAGPSAYGVAAAVYAAVGAAMFAGAMRKPEENHTGQTSGLSEPARSRVQD